MAVTFFGLEAAPGCAVEVMEAHKVPSEYLDDAVRMTPGEYVFNRTEAYMGEWQRTQAKKIADRLGFLMVTRMMDSSTADIAEQLEFHWKSFAGLQNSLTYKKAMIGLLRLWGVVNHLDPHYPKNQYWLAQACSRNRWYFLDELVAAQDAVPDGYFRSLINLPAIIENHYFLRELPNDPKVVALWTESAFNIRGQFVRYLDETGFSHLKTIQKHILFNALSALARSSLEETNTRRAVIRANRFLLAVGNMVQDYLSERQFLKTYTHSMNLNSSEASALAVYQREPLTLLASLSEVQALLGIPYNFQKGSGFSAISFIARYPNGELLLAKVRPGVMSAAAEMHLALSQLEEALQYVEDGSLGKVGRLELVVYNQRNGRPPLFGYRDYQLRGNLLYQAGELVKLRGFPVHVRGLTRID